MPDDWGHCLFIGSIIEEKYEGGHCLANELLDSPTRFLHGHVEAPAPRNIILNPQPSV